MARPYAWVQDDATDECAACARTFGLISRRRHHCRRCGRTFCDACSPSRLELPHGHHARLCTGCAEHVLERHGNLFAGDAEHVRALRGDCVRVFGDHSVLGLVLPSGAECDAACDGEMDACPACSLSFVHWAPVRAQRHVACCVSAPQAVTGDRFTVYVHRCTAKREMLCSVGANATEPNTAGLNGKSPRTCAMGDALSNVHNTGIADGIRRPDEHAHAEVRDATRPSVTSKDADSTERTSVTKSPASTSSTKSTSSAVECGICYEPYADGERVALLNCLCRFHEQCVAAWFERGRACPYHPVSNP